MPQIQAWAGRFPRKTAYEFPQTGETVTFGELHQRSLQAAWWLIDQGLQPGDHIALLMENHPTLFEIAWGAVRAGVYFTVISTHLKPREVAYILENSECRLFIVSGQYAETAQAALALTGQQAIACYSLNGAGRLPYPDYRQAVDAAPHRQDLPERPAGRDLLYSSGTTGLPKGVSKPLIPIEERDKPDAEVANWRSGFGFDENAVYLSPAPLYHAAPLRYSMRVVEAGGTVIVLGRFDPHDALNAIQQYRVTHSQWVPTMFIRMLDLPEDERKRYDTSSLKVAIHAAAPCPVHVKQRMIDWWGPIIWEYYAGSEGVGITIINSEDWLRKPGSVGRATLGKLHILDEDGRELPPGEVGLIYFSGGPRFEYYNEPEKTRSVYLTEDMATYGDLGYVDEDGFLFLSDRRTDLIISGGVNIYPQEIEDALLRHDAVADCAVIGVPNAEFGEEVKACVRLHPGHAPDAALEQALIAFCREHLSNVKCPRTVDFLEDLPRLDNGKLPRRLLKDRYREQAQQREEA
ncbi:MAG: acyl-CoA synthetase [Ectothiorhodospiraceae bacterium]|nr:acyl-CoA synthetase [Ectothiorhodospiraceae bacterium]